MLQDAAFPNEDERDGRTEERLISQPATLRGGSTMYRLCDQQHYCAEVVPVRLRRDEHCPPRTRVSSLRLRKSLAPPCISYKMRLGREDSRYKEHLAASLVWSCFASGTSAQTGPSASHSRLSTYNKDEIEPVFSSHSTALGRFES